MSRRYRQPHSALFGDGDGTWSPSDAGLAVAYERWLSIEEAERCPSCGTKHSEWIDPETKRMVDGDPWEAQTVTCYGCKAVAEARAQMPTGETSTGVSVVLVRPASDLDDES